MNEYLKEMATDLNVISTPGGDFILASSYSVRKLVEQNLIENKDGNYSTNNSRKHILDVIDAHNQHKNIWD